MFRVSNSILFLHTRRGTRITIGGYGQLNDVDRKDLHDALLQASMQNTQHAQVNAVNYPHDPYSTQMAKEAYSQYAGLRQDLGLDKID